MRSRIILRLLSFLKPYAAEAELSVVLGSAAVACGIGLLGTSAYLISAAAQHPSVAELQLAIVGVRFFGISRAVFRYLERLASHSVNFGLLAQLRSQLYRALEPLAPAGLEHDQSGDLLQRIVGDIEVLENFYVRLVSPVLVAIVITAGTSLFVGAWAPQLGWIVLTGLLLGGVGVPALAHRMNRFAAGQLVRQRAELSGLLVQTIQGIVDLSSYNAQPRWTEKIEQLAAAAGRSQMQLAWGGALSSAISLLVTNLTVTAVLAAAIPLVRANHLDGVLLAAVTLITLASFEAVTTLPAAGQLLESSLTAGARIQAVMDAPPPVLEPETSGEIIGTPEIHVHRLSYRYQAQSVLALDDFSLEIQPGRKTAVLGASGAGKTTLVQLLLRLRDGTSGEYWLGGQDARKFQTEQVRRLYSVVSQKPYLFTTSLRQNLLLGRPDAGDGRLWDVLEQVELHSWAEALPAGLDTWLGDRGAQMSGGQKQRLSAARALLKDAPYFLLDEPTAQLDVLTAERMLHLMLNCAGEKGVLLITHWLPGLEEFDEIIVLEAGRTIQRGTHAQLIGAPGWYRSMWELQRGNLD